MDILILVIQLYLVVGVAIALMAIAVTHSYIARDWHQMSFLGFTAKLVMYFGELIFFWLPSFLAFTLNKNKEEN